MCRGVSAQRGVPAQGMVATHPREQNHRQVAGGNYVEKYDIMNPPCVSERG